MKRYIIALAIFASPFIVFATTSQTIDLTAPYTMTGLWNFSGNASTTQLTSTGSTYLATTGGNVGIGTTTPSSLLTVNGNIAGANLTATGTVTALGGISTDWNTAYSWGNHAGLYDPLGQATSTLSSHTTTYNHANYDTAYGWGNHAGLYDVLGQATSSIGLLTGGVGLTRTLNDFFCDTATSAVFGCLASADWTLFNNKVSSTSIDTSAEIAALVTDETGTDKLVFSASPTLSGTVGMANYTATNGTTTNATSTSLKVLTSFMLPYSATETTGVNGDAGIDSTSNQFKYSSNGVTRVLGNGNIYSSFTYASTTAWTGTTTIPLGTAYVAETWNGVQCFTDVGTLNVSFYDGTNRMNLISASTTVGTTPLSTNNTFTAAEKRYVDVGTPATSPTKISCTVSKSITAD